MSPSAVYTSSSPLSCAAFNLTRLPYDIQEYVTSYLNRSDLYNLTLSSKHLSSLASRAFYASISLRSFQCSLHSRRALVARQSSFLIAIARHPEYAHFIRHIDFEFTDETSPHSASNYAVPEELVWKGFEKCTGVVDIDIKMSRGHDAKAPERPLFPNLRRAALQGTFPSTTLDRLLHTSPQLSVLRLAAGTSEYSYIPGLWTLELSSFTTRTIDRRAFKSLHALDVEIYASPRMTVTPLSLLRLLKHMAPSLEDLTLSLESRLDEEGDDTWHVWDLDSVFCGSKWEQLASLWLRGVEMTPRRIRDLKDHCPKLEHVKLSDTRDPAVVVLAL